MILDDVFLLIENRSVATVNKFIEHYLDDFNANVDSFEYPPFSEENEFETNNFVEMIEYLCVNNKRNYHFYLNPTIDNAIKQGMIFFNSDGSVILGLGVEEKNTSVYIDKLSKDFDSSLILICNIVLPPNNKLDFKLALKHT